VVYVGSFTDIGKAKEIALQMYAAGSSVVQAYAGGAANGVYQAAESMSEDYYAMGAATGQFDLSPNKIIASTVVQYDVFFNQFCQDFVSSGGQITAHEIIGGLENGGTGIKFSPEIGDRIPEDIIAAVEEARGKIVSGEITVPYSQDELDNFTDTL